MMACFFSNQVLCFGGAWGAVLRDDKGDVILSAWGKIQNTANAEAAEAFAGLQAVKAVVGAFAGPISIENDCATLIKEIKEANKSKPAIMNSVKEIRRLLDLFPSYSVSKINRAANQVAHNLAKLGRNDSTECVFLVQSLPVWRTWPIVNVMKQLCLK
jgi:ribonuclease HI